MRMPALFIGHGSPINALENNDFTRKWQELGAKLPKPKAILSISAHWMTLGQGPFVSPQESPRMIYDFRGFPPELSEVSYPAAGSPELAQRITELLPEATFNSDWGIDHGTWSVLVHLFPDADIPVVQLSLDLDQPFTWHYELGKKLAPLRDEGVLILGSGNVVHNLRKANYDAPLPAYPWAKDLDRVIGGYVNENNHSALVHISEWAPDIVHLGIPTPDHYLPLLYVVATQAPGEPTSFPVRGFSLKSLSMRSVQSG